MKIFLILFFLKFSYEADFVKIIPEKNFEIIVAKGNIDLNDGKTFIKGDSALIFRSYDVDSGFIYGNVNIKGEQIEINCRKAKYNFLKEEAEFFDKVCVNTEDKIVISDYIKYFAKTSSSIAKGEIFIEDKKEGLKVYSKEANYNFKNKRGNLKNIERLEILSEDKKITICGDEMEITPETLYLKKNVKIESEKEKGEGDTLIYVQKEEIAYLKGNPVFYFEKGSAKGNEIEIKFKDKKIEKGKIIGFSQIEILTEKEEKVIINTSIIESFFDEEGKIKILKGFEKIDGTLFLNKIKNEGSDKD
jgi:lipopolysaccharide assembly outer membrane protein LptD (OstA)